jgi:tRNA dimethylallyltransferase
MVIASDKPPLALIAGPTASGKSGLALALAERTGGAIVNADSAQVYRDLRVLSAAPSQGEQARADHRLYGLRDAADPCSAAAWAELARGEIAALHGEGRLPILVGGTGLYIRILLDGIAPVPPIDATIRQQVREAPAEERRRRLEELDPVSAARLNPKDRTRTERALEVVLATGRTLTHWQASRTGGIAASIALRPLLLLPPRDWLYDKCDERFSTMVERGAVAEVEALAARKLNPNLPAMRAIGVPELARYLNGELSLEDAVAAGQQATRRYAKRQYTWFAHQPPKEWPRFREPLDDASMSAALELLGASA